MKIAGIDHVVVRISNLDRSIAFYCGVLGCALDWRRDDIGLAHLRVGNAFVDLLVSTPFPADGLRNMDHLCLSVAGFDLEEAKAHLRANGIAPGEEGRRYGASGWGLSLYLEDPDGNGIELRG